MTPDEAADLAARTLAAIDRDGPNLWDDDQNAADRERVASDLAGLRQHHRGEGRRPSCSCGWAPWQTCQDGRRYEDGLRRTAALYGVTS